MSKQLTSIGSEQALPKRSVLRLSLGGLLAFSVCTAAATAEEYDYDVDAQRTDGSLVEIAKTSEVQVMFSPEPVRKHESPEIRGTRTVDAALDASLQNTDLDYEFKSDNFVVVTEADHDGDRAVHRPARAAEPTILLAQLQDDSTRDAASAQLEDADDSSDDDQTDAIDMIVVTGTRLNITTEQMSKKVITLDAVDLAAMGEVSLDRALQRLPQNFGGLSSSSSGFEGFSGFPGGLQQPGGSIDTTGATTVNLRGVAFGEGAQGTLVLVNGERLTSTGAQGLVQDISSIPLSWVERVDVMLDGASAIYGADAVGGVINIILKKDITSFQASATYSDSTESLGQGEGQIDFSGGFGWNSGNLSFGLNARSQDHITAEDVGFRDPFSTLEYSYITGEEEVYSNYCGSDLGNLYFGGDQALGRFYALTGYSAPSSIDDLRMGLNPCNSFAQRDVIPRKEEFSLRLVLSQSISDDLELSVSARHSRRDTDTSRSNLSALFRIDEDDPRNPFGEEFTLTKIFTGMPAGNILSELVTYNFETSVDWQISDRWSASISAAYGESENDIESVNGVSSTELTNISDLNLWGDGSDFLTRPYIDDNDGLGPGIWEDPFTGELLTGTQYEWAYRDGDDYTYTRNRERTLKLHINGSLFELPGGTVTALLGGELRNTKILTDKLKVGDAFSSGVDFDLLDATDETEAVYAEIFVPIFGDDNSLPGIRQLDLTAAVRHESVEFKGESVARSTLNLSPEEPYIASNSYDATTYSVGLVWSPAEDIRFKANYGTSFLAPPINQVLNAPSTRVTTVEACGRINPATVIRLGGIPGQCFNWITFRNPAVPRSEWWQDNGYTRHFGGGDTIEEQDSTTTTVGVDVFPTDNLMLSAAFNRTNFTNRPITLASLVNSLGVSATELLPEAFNFWPNGEIKDIFYNTINLESADTERLDLSASYNLSTGFGDIGVRAEWSHEFKNVDYVGSGTTLPPQDKIEVRNPRHNGNVNVNWSRDNWYLSTDLVYRSGTFEEQYHPNGDTGIFDKPLLSTNLSGSYSFDAPTGITSGMRIDFGINNLFKDEPTRAFYFQGEKIADLDSTALTGTNARLRTFYVRFSKEFF